MSDAAIARLEQSSEWHDCRLTKLETAQQANNEKVSIVPALGKTVEDHETRLRGIEKANFKLAGALSVLFFFASLGAQFVMKKIPSSEEQRRHANTDQDAHRNSTP